MNSSFFIKLSTDKPKVIYLILILISLLTAAQIPRIHIDADPENMLAEDHPARTFHQQTKQKFSMFDAIIVGVVAADDDKGIFTATTLSELELLTQRIVETEGVVAQDVMSFSTVDNITQGEGGSLRFDWLMKSSPTDDDNIARLKNSLSRLPLFNGTLISETQQAAAMYVPLIDKTLSYQVAESIRDEIGKLNSNNQWHISGLPVAEDQFGVEMFIQMGISAPLAGLSIFILLFLFFRHVPLIIAPMIVAMTTVIVTMGTLIGLGFSVHIMTSMIAIFLMPIAVVDSVHILSEFVDHFEKNKSAKAVIEEVMRTLFSPMLFTSLTSSVGFFSLMLTPIPPVQIFGAFVGLGILLAFIITITFVPAYITRMSPATLAKLCKAGTALKAQDTVTTRFARALGRSALRYRAMWLLMFALLTVISGWGVAQISINDNPVNWFKADHEIRVADKALNEEFAGTYNAYLVLEKAPEQSKSAVTLLNAAQLPASLEPWREQVEKQLHSQAIAEQPNNLLFAIDEKLFDVLDAEEEAALNTLLAEVEKAATASKVFTDPRILNYIENIQQHLQTTGLIGKSNSLADVVKVVNRELASGEDEDYRLPATQQAVAQTLMQYQSSHRPHDLWHFVTPDFRSSLIWLQLTDGDNESVSAVIDAVDEFISTHPLPAGLTYNWAGKAYLNVEWQQTMVAGMMDSLFGAFIVVFLMMILLFRSFIYGVLAMLPLSFTILFMYGLIGLLGKDYDMPIAVLSSLTLGLSVDFAIHFLQRARAELKVQPDVGKTLKTMFEEPARAISRNAAIIALGFTPLLLAPLVPYITVGVFLASIMVISALVTLILLPAVMHLVQRHLSK